MKINKKTRTNRKLFLNFKFILYIFMYIFIFSFIYLYVSTNYKFLVGNDLLNNTQVVLGGDYTIEDAPESLISSNNLFGPFRNMEVFIDNLNNVDYIYNVFKFSGFTPYETYDANFEFKIEGVDTTANLIVGTQTQEAHTHIDGSSDEAILNDIEVDNAVSFSRGYSDYVSTPLTFEANENGDIYMILGIDVGQKKVIDYKLSQVRLKL